MLGLHALPLFVLGGGGYLGGGGESATEGVVRLIFRCQNVDAKIPFNYKTTTSPSAGVWGKLTPSGSCLGHRSMAGVWCGIGGGVASRCE